VSTFMQIDKLVLLLESPVFAFLRLQLLQPHRCRSLIQALYGVLMLLPQSTAFDTLARRLRCVGPLSMVQMLPQPEPERPAADFAPLLAHFRGVQARVRAMAASVAAAALSRADAASAAALATSVPLASPAAAAAAAVGSGSVGSAGPGPMMIPGSVNRDAPGFPLGSP
jgi:hypothetical protein